MTAVPWKPLLRRDSYELFGPFSLRFQLELYKDHWEIRVTPNLCEVIHRLPGELSEEEAKFEAERFIVEKLNEWTKPYNLSTKYWT